MSRLEMRDSLAKLLVRSRVTRRFVRLYGFHRSPIHVVSYPKSGRTWLRFALDVALREHFGLQDRTVNALELNRLARSDRRLPSIRFSHDDDPHTKRAEELTTTKRAYRSKRVVFLARDPRDVVVSSYYQHTRRAPRFGDPTFGGSMADFVRDPVFGIETIIAFMNIWMRNSDTPADFLLLRYEDMVADFEREIDRVLRFVGVELSRAAVLSAVEASTFESMQAMERSDSLGAGRLRPADPSDPDSFKVRKAKIGGYVDELPAAERVFVDRSLASLDQRFGYEA